MIAPVRLDPVDPGRGVAAEGDSEKLEENSEGNSGATLEETAERDRNNEGREKNRDRRERSLGISQGQHSLGEDSRGERVATSL